MTTPRPKPIRPPALAILVAIAAFALPFAASAQAQEDPAVAADAAAEAKFEVHEDTDTLAADELRPDPRCLRHTGSRVTADDRSRTVSGRLDARGRIRCAHAPGTAYDRDDIDRTGATTVEEALEQLDPRIF